MINFIIITLVTTWTCIMISLQVDWGKMIYWIIFGILIGSIISLNLL